MADLRYAQVQFKGRHAGILRETEGGGTAFEYDPAFPEDLACALPRDQTTHVWPTGLHPVFQHLGPEGWLRQRQARTAEIADEDDFGLLLAYGADCIGAVSIHDPDAPPSRPRDADLDALTAAAVEAKRTISGVQPKLLVVPDGAGFVPAGATGPAPYIAKFPTDDLPSIVANEALILDAARVLLGPNQVVTFQRGLVRGIRTPALLVQRFDRTDDGRKLRLEDFAQILGRPQRRDFSGKYDGSFEEVAVALRQHSARAQIDLLRLFQRIVAFALLGNCDCHLKNFSLLETPHGLRLAPAYDVVNTYVYGRQGYSTRFGLRIDGRSYRFDQLDRAVLSALGERFGLPARAVAKTFSDLAGKKDALLRRLAPPDQARPDEVRALIVDTVASSYARVCP